MEFLKKLLSIVFLSKGIFAVVTITDPNTGDGAAGTSISEASTTATTAHTVAATSASHNLDAAAVIYSIDGSTTTTDFKFEFSNLLLKTKAGATFDYETKTEYVVIFTLADDETSTATGTLTVSIDDVDEYTPSFDGVEKCGAIPSTSLENAEVGIYAAHDMDGSTAGRVTSYAITGGDDGSAKFQISGGVITRTAQALDKATKSEYALVIEARGSANTATTTISVTLDGSCPGCGSGSGSGAGTLTAGVFTAMMAVLYHLI